MINSQAQEPSHGAARLSEICLQFAKSGVMGELGFLGMMVSPEYGGSGMDTMSYVLAMEEISKIDNSCSVLMSVNNSLVCWGIEVFVHH